MGALLFLDIETLGIAPGSAIWEVAAQRFEGGVLQGQMSVFVMHDINAVDPDLPQSFRDDYAERYQAELAIGIRPMFERLERFSEGAMVCGSNVSFDMERLERLAEQWNAVPPTWHYHPKDVPDMVHGYLWGRGVRPAQPWRTNFLSQAIGVDPNQYARHTALGDVQWCRAMWEAIGGQ